MLSCSRRTWLGLLAVGWVGCKPRSTAFPPPNTPPEIVEAWQHLNAIRREIGLPPVALDEGLSEGAALHARYLELNRVAPFMTAGRLHPQVFKHSPHRELPNNPGYTDEGHDAARHSNLSYSGTHREALDGQLSSYYHRLPLLRHSLTAVGMATRRNNKGEVYHVLRFENDGDDRYPGSYPIPNQRNVPLAFIDGENPEPRPPEWFKGAPGLRLDSGFPITMDWGTEHQAWAWRGALFKDDSSEVETHTDSRQFGFHVSVGVLPRSILEPKTVYRVVIEGVIDKMPRRFEWRFETRAS